MKKKITIAVVLIFIFTMTFGACNSGDAPSDNSGETPSAPSNESSGDDTAAPAEVKNIKFYAKIVEYESGEPSCELLQELLADKYNIEALQVDWGNLDQVIRTGISGGEPCDIYDYWPQVVSQFQKDDMVLDLTPYLDADGGAWRDTFDPSLLDLGTIGGKVYGLPTTPNFPTIVANKDLFDEAGVAIPEGTYWAWDDFLDACSKLKAAGISPFALPTDNLKGNWTFRNGLLSMAKDSGQIDAIANGEVPLTDSIVEKALTLNKELYDNGYMYPGEGAVTLTTDEARAAFAQGKVAMQAENSAGLSGAMAALPFVPVVVAWPAMGSSNSVQGGADGLFIPANVKDPDAAVEVMKVYTSAEVQQINSDYGFIVSVKGTTSSDPIVAKLSEFTGGVCGTEIMGFDPELDDFIYNQLLAELILGGGIEATMDKMEALRAAAAG